MVRFSCATSDEWDYFLSGLIRALSWKDGQDNALISEEPSWTYLGLGIHFLVIISFWVILFRILQKNKVRQVHGKELLKTLGLIYLGMDVSGVLALVLSLPMIFLVIPFYAGYCISNGVWRYHYLQIKQ